MSTIEKQIDIDVPAEVAWDCLHSVENYPSFLSGVQEARPEGKSRARLDLEPAARLRKVDAEITDRAGGGEQGDQMIWKTGGADLKGAFTVRSIDDTHSQVQVRVEYDPAKTREIFGGPKGFAQSDAIQELVQHDLEQFKDLAEGKR